MLLNSHHPTIKMASLSIPSLHFLQYASCFLFTTPNTLWHKYPPLTHHMFPLVPTSITSHPLPSTITSHPSHPPYLLSSPTHHHLSSSPFHHHLSSSPFHHHLSSSPPTIISPSSSPIPPEDEGRDLSCVISSLVQLMVDPYFRSISGFEALIQKEWVAMGYRFSTRHRLVLGNVPAEDSVVCLAHLGSDVL